MSSSSPDTSHPPPPHHQHLFCPQFLPLKLISATWRSFCGICPPPPLPRHALEGGCPPPPSAVIFTSAPTVSLAGMCPVMGGEGISDILGRWVVQPTPPPPLWGHLCGGHLCGSADEKMRCKRAGLSVLPPPEEAYDENAL